MSRPSLPKYCLIQLKPSTHSFIQNQSGRVHQLALKTNRFKYSFLPWATHIFNSSLTRCALPRFLPYPLPAIPPTTPSPPTPSPHPLPCLISHLPSPPSPYLYLCTSTPASRPPSSTSPPSCAFPLLSYP